MNKPFAEIIESCSTKFLAQTWDSQFNVKLGDLVEVTSKTPADLNHPILNAKSNSFDIKIFGIIVFIKTGSQDPMHYPFTYQKTPEELQREQPQIFEFLKTTFDVQIVGFKKNKILYSLPATPPKIHSFVQDVDFQIYIDFFSKTDFLNLLFNAQLANLDEILLAVLNNIQIQNSSLLSKSFLQNFCSDFSLLSGNDYKRLKLFLKRVQLI